jgi:hypothetical protein
LDVAFAFMFVAALFLCCCRVSVLQGLHHVVVEARGWHTAAVTAQYSSVTQAAASLLTWHCIAPPAAPSPPATASNTAAVAFTAGAVGVFYNHPSQCGFIPSLPPLLVLALRPSMGRLGLLQQQLVQQQLAQVVQQQVAGAGGGHSLVNQHQLVLHGPGKGAVRCFSISIVAACAVVCMQSAA